MVAKKFPDKVKKEVKAAKPDRFQGTSGGTTAGTQPYVSNAAGRNDTYAGNADVPWADIQVLEDYRRRTYRAMISNVERTTLLYAIRMLRQNNMARNMKLYCTYEDYNHLRLDREFSQYGSHPDIGMIFGMEVVLDRGNEQSSYIEVYR